MLETPNVKTRAISSQASNEEGSTTIPSGSTLKRAEARNITEYRGDDIVWSAWKHAAAGLAKVLCGNINPILTGVNMHISIELIQRFHEKWELDISTGCWNWIAATAGRGYGQLKIPGTRKQIYAHRLSYLIHYGKLDDAMFVCHACDNPSCVKPGHLFLGTSKDNLQDMKLKDRH